MLYVLVQASGSITGYWLLMRVFGVPEYLLISQLYSTTNMASISAKPLQNIYYERVSRLDGLRLAKTIDPD